MKRIILIPLAIAALVAPGCSTRTESTPASATTTPPKSTVTILEGTWVGREVTPGHEGPVSLTFSGQTLDFHGDGTDDWAKGTFTVRNDTSPKQLVGTITDCVAPDQIGKKSNSIFKLDGDTLTLTGNGPGESDFPAIFDASGTRQFVFKHKQ